MMDCDIIKFKWGNGREDCCFVSEEITQSFIHYFTSKHNIASELITTASDVPNRFLGYFGIHSRYIDWKDVGEFAELFDLKVGRDCKFLFRVVP